MNGSTKLHIFHSSSHSNGFALRWRSSPGYHRGSALRKVLCSWTRSQHSSLSRSHLETLAGLCLCKLPTTCWRWVIEFNEKSKVSRDSSMQFSDINVGHVPIRRLHHLCFGMHTRISRVCRVRKSCIPSFQGLPRWKAHISCFCSTGFRNYLHNVVCFPYDHHNIDEI